MLEDAIETARRFLEEGDCATAVFVLRDLPDTAAAGLSDLAWAMSKDGCVSRNDVLYLIESIHAHARIKDAR